MIPFRPGSGAVVVRAFGGLCNRLRVVLSYRAAFGPIDVVWHPDGEIADGRWSDVFEDLDGVRFLDSGDYGTATIDPYPHAPHGWQDGYRDVRLRPNHHARLGHLVSGVGPYSAIHVRRTDHTAMAQGYGTYTDDADFVQWLIDSEGPVYVATDNGTTQRAYTSLLGDRAIVAATIAEHPDQDAGGRRNTTLSHAAIDLFACVLATRFKGSGESSFTNTVLMLRERRGWWRP